MNRTSNGLPNERQIDYMQKPEFHTITAFVRGGIGVTSTTIQECPIC